MTLRTFSSQHTSPEAKPGQPLTVTQFLGRGRVLDTREGVRDTGGMDTGSPGEGRKWWEELTLMTLGHAWRMAWGGIGMNW